MIRSTLIAVAFSLLSSPTFAQTPASFSDAQVVIHENALNAFLTAVGPLSGRDNFKVGSVKGDYKWTVKNARIEVSPGKARFVADANVDMGIMKYGSETIGDVAVNYDPKTNRINVKVTKAELDIYVKILGKKSNITTIDLAKYYKPEFEFAGPQPLQESVEVELPDGSKKIIYIATTDAKMSLDQDMIVVASKLLFSDKPFEKKD